MRCCYLSANLPNDTMSRVRVFENCMRDTPTKLLSNSIMHDPSTVKMTYNTFYTKDIREYKDVLYGQLTCYFDLKECHPRCASRKLYVEG